MMRERFILRLAAAMVFLGLVFLAAQEGWSQQQNFSYAIPPITTVGKLSLWTYWGKGTIISVTDGTGSSDCSTGGGSTVLLCQYSGSSWSAVAGSGSMTWPTGGAGIPNYNGSSAWGTSYSATNTIPANFLPNAPPIKQFVTSTFSQTFNTSYTAANVVGLSWSLAANTNYVLQCSFDFTPTASTTALNYTLTGPASPTLVTVTGWGTGAAATTTATYAGQSAASFPTQFGQAATFAQTNSVSTFTAIIENGANAGTLQVQAGAGGAGTLTITAYTSGCVLY